jgi:flagellar biosynthesis regulator FlaF
MPDPENGLPRVDCAFSAFRERFGPETYEGRPWYAGASPSGRSSYQLVEAEGLDLLFLHLPEDAPEPEVVWAEGVLAAHPDTLAHLTTHRLIFDYRLTDVMPSPLDLFVAGRFNALTYQIGDQGLRFKDGNTADAIHQRLVVAQPNVWGVHCGHVDGELRLAETNARGLPAYEMLTDFQDMADGGGGLLRVLTFDVAQETITVATVSTETGRERQNGEGFEHSLDILEAYKGTAYDALSGLGFDTAIYDALFEEIQVEGSTLREEYRASLYAAGDRDSEFVLDVPFSAYVSEPGQP